MFSDDKARMFAAFDGAWDVHDTEVSRRRLLAMGEGIEPPPGTVSPSPQRVHGHLRRDGPHAHAREYGTTQREFAAVAAKNHGHSVHNPLAQYPRPTIEQILAATPITYPVTLPMCSPVDDGAAAAIVCSEPG